MKLKQLIISVLFIGIALGLQGCKERNTDTRLQAEQLKAAQKMEQLQTLNAPKLLPGQYDDVEDKYDELRVYFNENDIYELEEEGPIFYEMADQLIADLKALQVKEAKKVVPKTTYYTVKKGDNLWKIARDSGLFNHANEWTKIYDLNKDKIKKPSRIYPGQKFRLN